MLPVSATNLIEYIKDKKILILGFGREGVSTYNYIRKYFPEKPLAIADKKEISIDDKTIDFEVVKKV